jgi:DNA-binding transcriptional LysR family regulator
VNNREGIVTRLRDNCDDLYILSRPPAEIQVKQQPFLDNPLVVVAPEKHPLVGGALVELGRLADERFILRERGSGTRLAVDEHFAAFGFVPRVRLELGSNEAIKQAVAGGMGLSVLSLHALGHLRDEQLAVLPIAGFPIHTSWAIYYPKGKRLSPITREFLAHLVASARQLNLDVSRISDCRDFSVSPTN